MVQRIKKIFNSDYFISVFSKMIGVLLAIIHSAFYSRYLGVVLKGEAAIISNYVSIISSFAALGMYQAYPYYRKREENIFYSFVNNMTSLYLIMLMSCILIVVFLPLSINLKIAAVIVPVQAFIRHINYVVMVESPKTRAFSSIVISTLDLIIVFAFFFFTEAVYDYLVAILFIQLAINLVVSYLNLKVDIKYLKFDLKQIPKYCRYGILPMITLLLMTINYRIDIFMLNDVFDVSTADIGIYSVGVALAEKVWLIPDAIKDILMSRLSKNSDKYEVAKVTRVSLHIALAVLVMAFLLGRSAILILYGPDFERAYEILIIMLVGVVGMVFYKMVYSYNVVNGKKTINLMFLMVAAIVNAVLNLIFIPRGGIFAAAWSSVVSYLICGFVFLAYFCFVEKVKLTDMIFLKKEDVNFMTKDLK